MSAQTVDDLKKTIAKQQTQINAIVDAGRLSRATLDRLYIEADVDGADHAPAISRLERSLADNATAHQRAALALAELRRRLTDAEAARDQAAYTAAEAELAAIDKHRLELAAEYRKAALVTIDAHNQLLATLPARREIFKRYTALAAATGQPTPKNYDPLTVPAPDEGAGTWHSKDTFEDQFRARTGNPGRAAFGKFGARQVPV